MGLKSMQEKKIHWFQNDNEKGLNKERGRGEEKKSLYFEGYKWKDNEPLRKKSSL